MAEQLVALWAVAPQRGRPRSASHVQFDRVQFASASPAPRRGDLIDSCESRTPRSAGQGRQRRPVMRRHSGCATPRWLSEDPGLRQPDPSKEQHNRAGIPAPHTMGWHAPHHLAHCAQPEDSAIERRRAPRSFSAKLLALNSPHSRLYMYSTTQHVEFYSSCALVQLKRNTVCVYHGTRSCCGLPAHVRRFR